MGDHRASIKIQFEAHGVKKETDMWINYYPDETGVDRTVIEWFKEVWEECLAKYHTLIDEGIAERAAKEKEERRKQYEELRAEFED